MFFWFSYTLLATSFFWRWLKALVFNAYGIDGMPKAILLCVLKFIRSLVTCSIVDSSDAPLLLVFVCIVCFGMDTIVCTWDGVFLTLHIDILRFWIADFFNLSGYCPYFVKLFEINCAIEEIAIWSFGITFWTEFLRLALLEMLDCPAEPYRA